MNDEPAAAAAADQRSPSPASDSQLAAAKDPIALGLRRLWSGVEQETVPDDFFRILDEADSTRTEAGSRDSLASRS